MSHFVVEDEDLYEEALEAIDECGDRAEYRENIEEKLAELTAQPKWFSAVDARMAIATMHGLMSYLRDNPHLFTQYGDRANAAIVDDLERFANCLREIESSDIRFKFWLE